MSAWCRIRIRRFGLEECAGSVQKITLQANLFSGGGGSGGTREARAKLPDEAGLHPEVRDRNARLKVANRALQVGLSE